MKSFLIKNQITFYGMITGALAGYIYYYFWGCANSCSITSSSLNSMIYGTISGAFLFNIFQKENKSIEKKDEV